MYYNRYRVVGESFDANGAPIGEFSGNFWEEDISFWVREMLRYGRTYRIESRDGRQEEVDVIVAFAEVEIVPATPWVDIKKGLGL